MSQRPTNQEIAQQRDWAWGVGMVVLDTFREIDPSHLKERGLSTRYYLENAKYVTGQLCFGIQGPVQVRLAWDQPGTWQQKRAAFEPFVAEVVRRSFPFISQAASCSDEDVRAMAAAIAPAVLMLAGTARL